MTSNAGSAALDMLAERRTRGDARFEPMLPLAAAARNREVGDKAREDSWHLKLPQGSGNW